MSIRIENTDAINFGTFAGGGDRHAYSGTSGLR